MGHYLLIKPESRNMKRVNTRALVLTSFLLFAAPLYAREKTDVLVMKNGDRLTCEVKGLEVGVRLAEACWQLAQR